VERQHTSMSMNLFMMTARNHSPMASDRNRDREGEKLKRDAIRRFEKTAKSIQEIESMMTRFKITEEVIISVPQF
jgi:hypothetical protein